MPIDLKNWRLACGVSFRDEDMPWEIAATGSTKIERTSFFNSSSQGGGGDRDDNHRTVVRPGASMLHQVAGRGPLAGSTVTVRAPARRPAAKRESEPVLVGIPLGQSQVGSPGHAPPTYMRAVWRQVSPARATDKE